MFDEGVLEGRSRYTEYLLGALFRHGEIDGALWQQLPTEIRRAMVYEFLRRRMEAWFEVLMKSPSLLL